MISQRAFLTAYFLRTVWDDKISFFYMPENLAANTNQALAEQQLTDLSPTKEELSALSSVERAGFWLVRAMNRGAWKRFWTFMQHHIGSLWIFIATYNLMNVFGVENVENSDATRPLLLVANHRSFFDMYT